MATYIILKLSYTDNSSGAPVTVNKYIKNIDSENLQIDSAATAVDITKKWDQSLITATEAIEITEFYNKCVSIANKITDNPDYVSPEIEINSIVG